jgi:hypothetical protein
MGTTSTTDRDDTGHDGQGVAAAPATSTTPSAPLHAARRSGVEQWITAAAEKLHQAVVDYLAANRRADQHAPALRIHPSDRGRVESDGARRNRDKGRPDREPVSLRLRTGALEYVLGDNRDGLDPDARRPAAAPRLLHSRKRRGWSPVDRVHIPTANGIAVGAPQVLHR